MELVAEGDGLLRRVPDVAEGVEKRPGAHAQDREDQERNDRFGASIAHRNRLCLPSVSTFENESRAAKNFVNIVTNFCRRQA
jgi:hypothetical protein